MVSIKRLAWRVGLSALMVAVVASAAEADSLTIKRKKSFFNSLFKSSAEQKAIKQRVLLNKKKKKTLFGSGFWDSQSDPGVRIIYGSGGEGDLTQKRRIIDDDPEGGSGLGMGNLPYVPEKLVNIDGASFAVPRPAGDIEGAIYDALTGRSLDLRLRPAEREVILKHYEAGGFQPLWIDKGKLSERALAVVKTFAGAGAEGLDPSSYLPPGLASFDEAESLSTADSLRLAQIEIGLTVAALSYAHDASAGRFDPRRLSLYNDIVPEAVAPALALKVLAYSPYADAYLASLQPTHPAYAAMKAALAEIRQQDPGVEPVRIPAGPRVKLGKIDTRIPTLRDRLKQLGFTVADGADGADPLVLDEATSAALKEFQTANAIKASGQLETMTVNALNSHGSDRDKQRLLDNMERLRWLPKNLGNRYVFVNQAAFRVDVMDGGKPVWTSRVIVGKPMTQTAVFNDQIETVVFNPSWGVPASILANEYLPKLRRDPGYLDRIGFRVVDSRGRKVSSSSVDWWSYGSKVPYGVQQPPGHKNALGELKFLFPNSHDIYMHDTPNRNLFNEEVRAFSHGCVRVQNPRDFASVLLGWDRDKVDANTNSKQSQSVPLPIKVPIHITYFTAWPDETGKIQYFNDIYGRDESLQKARSALTIAAR
jgi:murein L,D-transpeptidase YcbB/YkuD